MNIFILDKNPEKCAKYHVDRHVVKMPLETAQLLCTALKLNGCENVPYKQTHINHPCSVWARKTRNNFKYLAELGLELCKEYTFRYERQHGCKEIIEQCLENKLFIPDGELTDFALAMPDEYRSNCAISSYRKYYINDKKHIAKWKNRTVPEWFN